MDLKIPALGLLCAVGLIVAGPILVALGINAPVPLGGSGSEPAPSLEQQLSSLIGILEEQARSLDRQAERLDRHAERLDELTQQLVQGQRPKLRPTVTVPRPRSRGRAPSRPDKDRPTAAEPKAADEKR